MSAPFNLLSAGPLVLYQLVLILSRVISVVFKIVIGLFADATAVVESIKIHQYNYQLVMRKFFATKMEDCGVVNAEVNIIL